MWQILICHWLLLSLKSQAVRGITSSQNTVKSLTHWGQVTHICTSKLTSAGILSIGPLGTKFNEILIEIQTFSFQENAFENVVCEILAILFLPQCVKHKQSCLEGFAVCWCIHVPLDGVISGYHVVKLTHWGLEIPYSGMHLHQHGFK